MDKKGKKSGKPTKAYLEKDIKKQYKLSKEVLKAVLPPHDFTWNIDGVDKPAWSKERLDRHMKNPKTLQKIEKVKARMKKALEEECSEHLLKAVMTESAANAKVKVEKCGYRETVRKANIFYSKKAEERRATFHMAKPHAIVNYIRHQMTNYDDVMGGYKKSERSAAACCIAINKTFDAMEKAYPWYKDVIEDQRTEHLQRYA